MTTFKQSKQMEKNGQTFDALPVGGMFQVVARRSYRLIDVYTKIGEDRVQAGDGRQWALAQTEIPSSGVIVVPQGAYTNTAYDVEWNR